MAGPQEPRELPPEYAEAYRRAYERARAESSGQPVPDFDEPTYEEPTTVVPVIGPEIPPETPAAAPGEATGPEQPREPRRDDHPAWFVPLVLVALALLLILGAYLIGRILSSDAPDPDDAEQAGSNLAAPYDGPLHAVRAESASAKCQSPSGVDAAGARTSYPPANMLDADPSTAWRCNGDAQGERLVFDLPDGTTIGEVGLVPGYAKTDPKDHTDRYAQNNRITEVQWIVADGVEVTQRIDGDPKDRRMRTLRVPPTETDRIVLEIRDVERGPRNTTAISGISLAAPES